MRRAILLQHVKRECGGLFLDVLKEFKYETIIINLFEGKKIPKINSEDIVIIMGGPMSINDIGTERYAWLKDEILLIKFCIQNNIKLIGICLGAQLIAHCLGGRVERLKDDIHKNIFRPEIGWSKIRLIHSSSNTDIDNILINGLHVLHWHGDRIILPNKSNLKLLASSTKCKEQFFKFRNIFGLQCHIEVTERVISKWIKEDNDFIEMGLGQKAQKILKDQTKRYCDESESRRLDLIRSLICYS